eukprot:363937-Chlamydomonas_euryale.AAC.11
MSSSAAAFPVKYGRASSNTCGSTEAVLKGAAEDPAIGETPAAAVRLGLCGIPSVSTGRVATVAGDVSAHAMRGLVGGPSLCCIEDRMGDCT